METCSCCVIQTESRLNFFKAMGLDYIYVEDGNDITSLIAAFKQVKDAERPVRCTHSYGEMDTGYAPAVENRKDSTGACLSTLRQVI